MKRAFPIIAALLLCACADAEHESSSLPTQASVSSPAETTTAAPILMTETPTSASAAAAQAPVTSAEAESQTESSLTDKSDLCFKNTDGSGSRYEFLYNGEVFTAVYTPDNWKIINSYKIDNEADMLLICKTLSEEHPIHGKDMVSYREPEDMVYEWQQHNLAYSILPDSSQWKLNARDVDLNPEDQGRSLYEMFLARTEKQR